MDGKEAEPLLVNEGIGLRGGGVAARRVVAFERVRAHLVG